MSWRVLSAQNCPSANDEAQVRSHVCCILSNDMPKVANSPPHKGLLSVVVLSQVRLRVERQSKNLMSHTGIST